MSRDVHLCVYRIKNIHRFGIEERKCLLRQHFWCSATSLLPFTHSLLCPLSHPFPWDRSSSDRDFYCWSSSTTEIRPLADLGGSSDTRNRYQEQRRTSACSRLSYYEVKQ